VLRPTCPSTATSHSPARPVVHFGQAGRPKRMLWRAKADGPMGCFHMAPPESAHSVWQLGGWMLRHMASRGCRISGNE
jgi:hypothetical protein